MYKNAIITNSATLLIRFNNKASIHFITIASAIDAIHIYVSYSGAISTVTAFGMYATYGGCIYSVLLLYIFPRVEKVAKKRCVYRLLIFKE